VASTLYEPLYPPDGGPVSGYRCAQPGCPGITRTKRGMHLHLTSCHGIRAQQPLFNDEPDPVETGDLPAGVRGGRT
jgi:hypothetical protein